MIRKSRVVLSKSIDYEKFFKRMVSRFKGLNKRLIGAEYRPIKYCSMFIICPHCETPTKTDYRWDPPLRCYDCGTEWDKEDVTIGGPVRVLFVEEVGRLTI